MKKIFVVSFISVGYFLNAQNLSNSPYATYGIGDVKYDNTIETTSMGGISTAFISDFTSNFNFANPANNANFELTSIKLEATNENNYFKQTIIIRSLPNILRIYPIFLLLSSVSKIEDGISYQPYSSKAMILSTEIRSAGNIRANRFKGSGTLNTAQMALSYKVNDKLLLGKSELLFRRSL
jgi:hypothetical protein